METLYIPVTLLSAVKGAPKRGRTIPEHSEPPPLSAEEPPLHTSEQAPYPSASKATLLSKPFKSLRKVTGAFRTGERKELNWVSEDYALGEEEQQPQAGSGAAEKAPPHHILPRQHSPGPQQYWKATRHLSQGYGRL